MAATSTNYDQERASYAKFVCQHAEAEYRGPLAELYAFWHNQAKEYYTDQLKEPHMEFGRTAHNAIGHCEPTTNYGGRLLITLNRSLFIEPKRSWIRNPWPSEGLRRFVEDLVLRFLVRQYVLEVREKEEHGYRGYGPAFTTEANRIGIDLGLVAVSVRRRPGHEDDGPPCIGWPHCVRPAGYYGVVFTRRGSERNHSVAWRRRKPRSQAQKLTFGFWKRTVGPCPHSRQTPARPPSSGTGKRRS